MRRSKRSSTSTSKRSYQHRDSRKIFVQLRQLIFFSGLSAVLIILLVQNGGEPIYSENIVIKGHSDFNKEEILRASRINFPKPLIRLIPKQIESNLIRELSFRQVKIRRQILPAKLIIEVLEREPISFAERKGEQGFETGMIDQTAKWIPIEAGKKKHSNINLFVKGWHHSHRKQIALILINRENLGSALKEINLSAVGEISLQTKNFKLIKLGSNQNLLIKQIKILSNLNKALPEDFVNNGETTIDLRDPSKPELQTGKTY